MIPGGLTNFDYGGSEFRFFSATGNAEYDFLEIPSPKEARWMGRGTLSLAARRILKKAAPDIVYGFMVAVQDKGEPGDADTLRLRIWNPAVHGHLVLDSDGLNPVVPASCVFDTNPHYPTGINDADRFWGAELGDLDSKNGGGNIQIHWKA